MHIIKLSILYIMYKTAFMNCVLFTSLYFNDLKTFINKNIIFLITVQSKLFSETLLWDSGGLTRRFKVTRCKTEGNDFEAFITMQHSICKHNQHLLCILNLLLQYIPLVYQLCPLQSHSPSGNCVDDKTIDKTIVWWMIQGWGMNHFWCSFRKFAPSPPQAEGTGRLPHKLYKGNWEEVASKENTVYYFVYLRMQNHFREAPENKEFSSTVFDVFLTP